MANDCRARFTMPFKRQFSYGLLGVLSLSAQAAGAQDDSTATPTGHTCPTRFPADNQWKAAIKDFLSGQCWSCPTGYDRTAAGVSEDNACSTGVFGSTAKAWFRGMRLGPIAGKGCVAAPTGDKVTFLVATDPQIGRDHMSATASTHHVRELNHFWSRHRTWPSTLTDRSRTPIFSDEPMSEPHAVITTGDLTNSGHDHQLTFFRWLYEKEGREFYAAGGNGLSTYKDHVLKYPVFVGLGNHDTDNDSCAANGCAAGMYRYVRIRNGECSELTSFDFKDDFDLRSFSYAWKWNNVHYIQLHGWAGAWRYGVTRHATAWDWLENYFKNSVASDEHVVLFQHFPPDRDYSSDGNWPQPGDPQKLADRILRNNVSVIAIFAGHTHSPSAGDWSISYTDPDTGVTSTKSIPFFVGGTGGQGGKGNFYVVEVAPSEMKVGLVQWRMTISDNRPTLNSEFVPNNPVYSYNRRISF